VCAAPPASRPARGKKKKSDYEDQKLRVFKTLKRRKKAPISLFRNIRHLQNKIGYLQNKIRYLQKKIRCLQDTEELKEREGELLRERSDI
jgi:predicted ribosome quality control (RQC) complex YloA/Tae2 family protein